MKELELFSFEEVNIVLITSFVSSTILKRTKNLINWQTAFRQRRITKKMKKEIKLVFLRNHYSSSISYFVSLFKKCKKFPNELSESLPIKTEKR